MIYTKTKLDGVVIIDIKKMEDERGFFARSWCADEFKDYGLNPNLVQCSISYNLKKGTLRGMHYQADPHQEDKVVRCSAGAIYDVTLDLRPDSETFRQWFSIELNAENRRAVYVPIGCAHGFQTLEDNSEVYYQMSENYHPECAIGVRWNDPAFGIDWPISNWIISKKDMNYKDYII